MNIDHANKLKAELERGLADLITKYQDVTGLCVTGAHLNLIRTMEDRVARTASISVQVELP